MRNRHTQSGFTLVELLIVMAIIGILVTMAIPRFTAAVQHAREAVLREDLQTMRMAIDSYTMDKQKAPQSLDDLIQDGYLKSVPEDPMTHSKDTWVTEFEPPDPDNPDAEVGIFRIRSGSTDMGENQIPYNEW